LDSLQQLPRPLKKRGAKGGGSGVSRTPLIWHLMVGFRGKSGENGKARASLKNARQMRVQMK